MTCSRCANEVRQNEAFCGQCGMPNTPPAQPTQKVYAPPSQNGWSTPSPSITPSQNAPRISQHLGEMSHGGSYPSSPQQQGKTSPTRPLPPNQHTGFYQNATEAISSVPLPTPPLPSSQSFPGSYTMYPAPPLLGNTPMQQQPLPPTSMYNNQMYMQASMGVNQQVYRQDKQTYEKTVDKQPKNVTVVIVSICVTIVLLSVIGLGTLFLLKNRSNNTETTTGVTVNNTATTTTIPTLVPSPTPMPTDIPTAIPTISLTPTTVPTPTPDAGFQWCTPACATLGYLIEYPATWSPGTTTDVQGYQYINPAAADEIVAVKVPGQTTNQPGDILTNDLQTNFQNKPGYTGPTTPPTTTTIGGTIWLTQTVSYQNNESQKQIRVVVFSTVYQQKAYLIELQANNDQFDMVQQQTFSLLLKSFSFQTAPQA